MQLANRLWMAFGCLMLTAAWCRAGDFRDDLATTANFYGGFGSPVVTNNGDGTASVIKTLATTDTGATWRPGGASGVSMPVAEFEAVSVTGVAPVNGGYYSATLLMFDQAQAFLGEGQWIPSTQLTNTFCTNIVAFIESQGYAASNVTHVTLRIRVNDPWAANNSGFQFTRIMASRRSVVLDSLGTPDNFYGAFGAPVVASNGNSTVSIYKTLSTTDTGVNWRPGGSEGSLIALADFGVLSIRPTAAVAGGYFSTSLLLYNGSQGFVGEVDWIPSTQSTDTFSTGLVDFVRSHGYGSSNIAYFVPRIRINDPWAANNSGFTFTEVALAANALTLDGLVDTNNFCLLFGSPVLTNNGGNGRVSVTKTLALTDTGVTWRPGGAAAANMSTGSWQVVFVRPDGALNGGEFSATFLLFDSNNTFIAEPSWIASTSSTETRYTNVIQFITDSGYGSSGVESFALRLRVNEPFASNNSGFAFQEILAGADTAPPVLPGGTLICFY